MRIAEGLDDINISAQMVGITVKGRFREMCLLLMLVIIGTRLMCRISLL